MAPLLGDRLYFDIQTARGGGDDTTGKRDIYGKQHLVARVVYDPVRHTLQPGGDGVGGDGGAAVHLCIDWQRAQRQAAHFRPQSGKLRSTDC